MHEPDISALQLCIWWGTVNRMRDRIIYQAHLAGISVKEIAEAIGLHHTTVSSAIERQGQENRQ